MRPSSIRETLKVLIPAREPALLVGSPGVGKTSVVEAVAEELGYDLMVTHPVVDDPTDYKGMPAIVKQGRETTAAFLPFGNLQKMLDADKPMIVFMDDLGQSPPAVQSSIMQLVLAREINGQRVSEHVQFLAATNRRQDQAAVTGLITPLLDRFTTVLTFDFDLEDWIKWGIENNMPHVLLAFARFRTDLISKFEANRDMKKSPTPRSVAGVGRLLNAGLDSVEILSGAAGEGFATEFKAFYDTWRDLPDRTTIYMNPDTAPVPERPDVLYALMGSLAHGANDVNFEATVRYLNRVPSEFSVLCMKDAMKRTPSLTQTQPFIRWANDHANVFGYGN